jgi:hypothetical protein
MTGIKELPKKYRRQVLFDSARKIYAELGYQFGIDVTDYQSTFAHVVIEAGSVFCLLNSNKVETGRNPYGLKFALLTKAVSISFSTSSGLITYSHQRLNFVQGRRAYTLDFE